MLLGFIIIVINNREAEREREREREREAFQIFEGEAKRADLSVNERKRSR
jgi:hypothetical protein